MLRCAIALILLPLCLADFNKPYAVVQAFRPRGFQISIPDDYDGISRVKFHINVNIPIDRCQEGDISGTVLQKTDGKWLYRNSVVKLKKGDSLNFWIEIQRNNKEYEYTSVISDFTNNKGEAQPTRPRPTMSTTESIYYYTTQSTSSPSLPQPEANERPADSPQQLDCTWLVQNTTNILIDLQKQLSRIKEENAILKEIAEKEGNLFLKLAGLITETDEPMAVVKFVLLEKLDISQNFKRAWKHNNETVITFEVFSFQDKLNILREARHRLLNSKQISITL